jgi:TolA-binding protein
MSSVLRLFVLAPAALLLLWPPAARSSGQDGPYFPNFIAAWGPPGPLARSIDEPLGVVESSWWRKPLLLAWYRLNDMRLPGSAREYFAAVDSGGTSPVEVTPAAAARWGEAARAAAADVQESKLIDTAEVPFTNHSWEQFANCPGSAWEQARTTLAQRQRAWGADSAALKDWVKAQHQVFARCGLGPSYFRRAELGPGRQPNALYVQSVLLPDMTLADPPTGTPPLLVKDRAYQRASALFYEGHYAQAERAFDAVAADAASPWQAWGSYLALRARLRAIQIWPEADDPYERSCSSAPCIRARIDAEAYRRREGRRLRADVAVALRSVRQGGDAQAIRRLEQLQALVAARLDAPTRFQELAAILQRPDVGAVEFRRAAVDYLHLHRQHPPREPLGEWLAGLIRAADPSGKGCRALGPNPKSETDMTDAERIATERCLRLQWSAESLARFEKEPKRHAWLFSAAALAERDDAHLPRLLEALAAVPAAHPGAPTFMLQRVRLGDRNDALAAADALLKRPEVASDYSARNRVHEFRLRHASSLEEFWGDAIREEGTALDRDTLMSGPARGAAVSPVLNWDYDAEWILNYELSHSALVDSARRSGWPADFRSRAAGLAWGKALWRGNAAQAREAAALLHSMLDRGGDNRNESSLGALLAIQEDTTFILESRVSPSAAGGRIGGYTCRLAVPKAEDYTPEYEEQVGNLKAQFGQFAQKLLSASELAVWRKERAELDALPDMDVLRMRARLEFAERFPSDARVPGLLAEAIIVPRNNWCAGEEAGRLSKRAFELLKRRYPTSEAAKNAKYWFAPRR